MQFLIALDFLHYFNITVLLLNNEKLDIKYAGILRILLVYWTRTIAIIENIVTTIPNGIYLADSN